MVSPNQWGTKDKRARPSPIRSTKEVSADAASPAGTSVAGTEDPESTTRGTHDHYSYSLATHQLSCNHRGKYEGLTLQNSASQQATPGPARAPTPDRILSARALLRRYGLLTRPRHGRRTVFPDARCRRRYLSRERTPWSGGPCGGTLESKSGHAHGC